MGYIYLIGQMTDQNKIPMECAWSQALLCIKGAFAPIQGFGASDCHSGCQAHLVYVSEGEMLYDPLRERIHALLPRGIIDISTDQQSPMVSSK